MVVYNVTIKVDNDVIEDWLQWMKNEHIPDLMNTDLFAGYRLCRLLEQDEVEGVTYVAQYFCDTIEHYTQYIDKYAQTMRDRTFDRFGNKLIAFRTLMEVEAAGGKI